MKSQLYVGCIALVPVFVAYLVAQEADPSVLTVERISKLPKEIVTCELNYRYHDSRGQRVETRRVVVDGDKYYIETGQYQTGFDGESYWSKDHRRPTPRVEKASFLGFKQLDTHPLNAPYAWVWDDPKIACWSDLRKEETWNSIGKRMSYRATRTVHRQICDVFVVDYPESERRYTVAFSRELDGFPVQLSVEIKGKHFSTGDVLETHRVGGVVIATKGQAKNKFSDELKQWIDVDVESIQVNQPINSAIFRP